MDLLIDIGNSSIKWAGAQPGALGPMASARHFGALPIDLLAAWDGLAGIDRVLAACVGPDAVLTAVEQAAAACWGRSVERIETRLAAHGVRIAYPEPSRLGVDRFLALIGAHRLDTVAPADDGGAPRRRPKLVVDAGTAVTYDALAADGTHLGGQILPGIDTLRASLLERTQLPSHHTYDQPGHWGGDTGPGISAASLHAPAALADRLLARLRAETTEEPLLILTGGDAERLAPLLDTRPARCPDLILRGLACFAE